MSCYRPITIRSTLHDNAFIEVPCGKCAGCRKTLRDSWFMRFREEAKGQFSRFITLTYDDENLPFHVDEDAVIHYDVDKKHLQKFLKRVRKNNKFKYFAVSEYGSKDGRPHYHLLLFSPERIDVERYWKYGFVKDLPAKKGSYKYITKYLLKGSDGVPEGSLKNFMICSKRPAIGLRYLDTVTDDQFFEQKFMMDNDTPYPLPRYFRKKIYQRLADGGEMKKTSILEELETSLSINKLKEQMRRLGHDPEKEDVRKFFAKKEKQDYVKQQRIKQGRKDGR